MTTKRLYIPESERLYEIIGRQQAEIEKMQVNHTKLQVVFASLVKSLVSELDESTIDELSEYFEKETLRYKESIKK